jgi:hypothetical protein
MTVLHWHYCCYYIYYHYYHHYYLMLSAIFRCQWLTLYLYFYWKCLNVLHNNNIPLAVHIPNQSPLHLPTYSSIVIRPLSIRSVEFTEYQRTTFKFHVQFTVNIVQFIAECATKIRTIHLFRFCVAEIHLCVLQTAVGSLCVLQTDRKSVV